MKARRSGEAAANSSADGVDVTSGESEYRLYAIIPAACGGFACAFDESKYSEVKSADNKEGLLDAARLGVSIFAYALYNKENRSAAREGAEHSKCRSNRE